MERLRKIKSGLPGAALALCLSVTLLALLLYICGTCAPLMEAMFRTHAPASVSLLPENHYGPVARMITGYLAGTAPEFQYTVSNGETQIALFHDYEQLHMHDCKALFDLCRNVLLVGAVLSVALLRMVRAGRPAMKGMCVGAGLVLALAAMLGIAAAIDFSSVFVLFHQLSFSNDMWMLNPHTDLLIRLMPLDFFIHYVCLIGGVWIAGMLGMLFVGARLGFGQ